MPDEQALDPKSAGKLLGLSAKTIIRYAEQHIIPGRKIGSRWRFHRAMLDEWMRAPIDSSAVRRALNPKGEKS